MSVFIDAFGESHGYEIEQCLIMTLTTDSITHYSYPFTFELEEINKLLNWGYMPSCDLCSAIWLIENMEIVW